MRCPEFEDRMNDVLDQRALPESDALLRHHAAECAACRQLLDGQAVLFAGLELAETPRLSPIFAATVLEQSAVTPVVVANNPRRKSAWFALAAGLASLATVALVAALMNLPGDQPGDHAHAGKPSTSPVIVKNESPKAVPPGSIAKVVAPPKITPTLPPKVEYTEVRQTLDSWTAQLPSAVEKMEEVQQSTPAIRPLRASFSMAIGTLQRTIPNRAKRDSTPPKPDSGFFGQPRDVVV
jgi:hypothetical protein